MQVSDIISGLKFGELRHFNFGESAQEGVFPIHFPMLINLINQGVKDIYSKVKLSHRELYLQPIVNKTTYRLHPKYAVTNTVSTEVKYIIDSPDDPFKGNLLRILAAFTECGKEIPLNDHNDCESLHLVGLDIIQVPDPQADNAITIIYQSGVDKLEESDDITQEVDLPSVYEQALMLFIVAKAHLSRAHLDSEVKHSDYMSRYQNELDRLVAEGYVLSDATSCKRLSLRGFV
jgi:hypothetical protein